MWNNPTAVIPIANGVTCSGHIIKTPDRLTYAPAAELRCLGEMAEPDDTKLVATYMALLSMKWHLQEQAWAVA